jgi:NTP pyrophosphatase (non-canonical NTP hydrolase)
MTFDEYQKGCMRTAGRVTTATKENMLLNGVMGAAGEAGELVDLMKKELFQGHPFDREHYIKECGDVLYYLALIAESLDTTLEHVAITNNQKLWERYPNGFSTDKSVHRKAGDI